MGNVLPFQQPAATRATAVKSDFGYTFDHDVAACRHCHLTGDYFQDGPCPKCGHTFTGMATTYDFNEHGPTWKTFWCLCDRCRIAQSAHVGSTVFSYDETGDPWMIPAGVSERYTRPMKWADP